VLSLPTTDRQQDALINNNKFDFAPDAQLTPRRRQWRQTTTRVDKRRNYRREKPPSADAHAIIDLLPSFSSTVDDETPRKIDLYFFIFPHPRSVCSCV